MKVKPLPSNRILANHCEWTPQLQRAIAECDACIASWPSKTSRPIGCILNAVPSPRTGRSVVIADVSTFWPATFVFPEVFSGLG
jgi:hypothetical protein